MSVWEVFHPWSSLDIKPYVYAYASGINGSYLKVRNNKTECHYSEVYIHINEHGIVKAIQLCFKEFGSTLIALLQMTNF